ncbi:MAG: hypothetical protein O7D30_03660, partial [Rickettsia endosymbiont of Ixodes persulcatus]|nr:hypothetical protein [Rickettsia endosymbiont of Ixodes persulcatus]
KRGGALKFPLVQPAQSRLCENTDDTFLIRVHRAKPSKINTFAYSVSSSQSGEWFDRFLRIRSSFQIWAHHTPRQVTFEDISVPN